MKITKLEATTTVGNDAAYTVAQAVWNYTSRVFHGIFPYGPSAKVSMISHTGDTVFAVEMQEGEGSSPAESGWSIKIPYELSVPHIVGEIEPMTEMVNSKGDLTICFYGAEHWQNAMFMLLIFQKIQRCFHESKSCVAIFDTTGLKATAELDFWMKVLDIS